MIGNVITFAAAIFVMIDPEAVDASDVGLVISYALQVRKKPVQAQSKFGKCNFVSGDANPELVGEDDL